MVPVFRKIRVMSTKKSSGGVNSGHGWSHKRLEGGQIAASQPAWNKENVALTDQKEVLSFAIHKENVPSTNDKEWTDGGSNEGDRRQSSLQPEFVIRAPPRPFYG